MISTLEKVLFLKSVELFGELSGEQLSHLADVSEEVEHRAGSTIFKEGHPGDAMFLIIEGSVSVQASQSEVAQLGAGQCFGEMAILDATSRSATITALSELSLLRIQREDFDDILQDQPEISRGIIRVLTQRLREANQK